MESYRLPKFDYPEKYDVHMIRVPKKAELPVLDENYPYINKTKRFRFLQWLTFFFLRPVAYLLCKTYYGMRVRGRKILKQNKELLKNGAITVCNHVLMMDFLLVQFAVFPRREIFAAWPINLMGPNRHLIRLAGGVPIPESFRAMRKFNAAIDGALEEGKWLHIYPETAMWFYYDKIRPFKKGVFTYAVRHNKPVIPLVINYRRRSWLGRIFSKKPAVTITVSEPIMPDLTLDKREAALDLLTKSRTVMQRVAGFSELIDQDEIYRVPPAAGTAASGEETASEESSAPNE